MHSVTGSTVVFVQARSATEQAVLARWAAAEYPGAPLVEIDPEGRTEGLDQMLADDGLRVVPARVTWSPAEDDRSRAARLTDLLAASRRRPWSPLHAPLARWMPDSARVVAGEPATVATLRAGFADQTRPDEADDDGFTRYVLRQGALACDRAERRVMGDRYKVPRLIVEQITGSSRFAGRVAELAAETGRPAAEVESRLREYLSEMVAVQSPPAIDAFRAAMGPLHSRAWNVDVDEAGLARLRALNQEHPLIFLPSHRSLADPLVLAEVLHTHDFPRNHVLTGADQAIGPFAALGRRAGVVLLRRSMGDDPIYRAAVREYLGQLLAKRFNLEWYIEGGRTRTGKLRRPRYGLLRYLAGALDERPELDAVLVPVSIVYDQLHEVGAMVAEQRGGAAQRTEGLRWLARYARAQRRNVGVARVSFGEPFALRSALAQSGSGGPRLEKVAFRVCDGINAATAVTANSLVTFALLSTRDRALTLDQVADVVAPLTGYLRSRGVSVPRVELETHSGLCDTLERLAEARVVRMYDRGTEPVFAIAPGRHHVAAFYRNGALHHLVNRALAELAMLRVARAGPGEDYLQAAWTQLWRLRDLLKFEFFFAEKREFSRQVLAEVDLLDPGWRTRAADAAPREVDQALRAAPMLVAHGTLRSFLDAQLVLAEFLVDLEPDAPVERSELLRGCLGLGRQLLLQHRLDRADSVSAELYDSALRLADNRGLLGPGGSRLAARRRRYRDEVHALLGDLGRIGAMESARLEQLLGARTHGRPQPTAAHSPMPGTRQVGACPGSE